MNKTATEMFEELEFKLIKSKMYIMYERNDGGLITQYIFNKAFKRLEVKEYELYNDSKPQGFTIYYVEHIKAITQQMKELGWL